MTSNQRLSLGPDRSGRVVVLERDRIAAIGNAIEPEGRTLDCPDAELRPGFVNAHTHIYSALAPLGMPPPEREPRTFVEILERVWWRLDRAIDADSLRASARLYVAEALLAGTTTIIDHHESPNLIGGSLDVIAEAYRELGARGALCYGATERNGGAAEARQGLDECARLVAENRDPLVRALIGLHASFTVSDATVRASGALCRELEQPLHIHMGEDRADRDDARSRGYAGPLERLIELDALPPLSVLAHGVFLDASQVRRAAENGAWFVQNPRSNRGNRVGYPPALAASQTVALGTDGYRSVMADELAVLREEAAQHDDDPQAVERRLPAGRELAAALFGGSFELEAGATGDLVAIGEDGAVRHVVVAGRVVVENGELLTGDLTEIRADAERQAPLQWRRLRELG